MEPVMPTSFIPKRPVSSEPVAPKQSSRVVGLLSLFAVVVAITTVVAFIGVYLYGKQLESQKVSVQKSINDAKNGIGTEFLADMKRLNARIDGVKLLLANHVVVSPIFTALQDTTLRSVQYKSFGYALVVDPTTKVPMVQVTLTGSAKSYATIALQSDAFTESALIKNPVFSNLTVDDKTNAVNFKLVFDVTPSDLSYETFIKSVSASATTL